MEVFIKYESHKKLCINGEPGHNKTLREKWVDFWWHREGEEREVGGGGGFGGVHLAHLDGVSHDLRRLRAVVGGALVWVEQCSDAPPAAVVIRPHVVPIEAVQRWPPALQVACTQCFKGRSYSVYYLGYGLHRV